MGALQSALKSLKKNKIVDLKKATVDLSDSQKPIPCIPTGSIVLDYLIGGYRTQLGGKRCPGIPRGRVTEIFGPEGSGKTTVAIQAAIRCQAEGGSVLFLDYEHAFSPTYAADLGLTVEDEDTFILLQPRHWEEGAEIIQVMVGAGVDLIIVDSLAAIKPRRDVEDNDVSSTGQVGHIARLQSSFLPKIVGDIEEQGTSLIYLNQLRSRIKTSMYDAGPDEETSGGRALKYFASLRISLKRVKTEYAQVESELTGKSEKQPISNIIRAKNVKNKVSKHQGHQAEFVIRYGEGIDNVRSVIDIGEARKVVHRAGAWYSFEGEGGMEVKAQGKEGLRSHLIENSGDFHALVGQIQSFAQERFKIGKISDDDIIVEDVEAEEKELAESLGLDDD